MGADLRDRRRAAPAVASLAALAVAACAPDLGPMPATRPLGAYATSQSLAAPSVDWPADAWWAAYGDAALDALMDAALKGAPDLAIASARVRRAQALAEQADAERKPQLAVNASSQTTKQSLNEGFPPAFQGFLPAGYHTQTRATLDLSFDLDFFGANRARLAAATSQAQAQAAEYAAARLQITTQVAQAWAELARLYADRDAAADAVRVRSDSARLVGERLRNGLETQGEFAQARGGVPAAQQDVDALDRQITAQRYSIAALAGLGPDDGLKLPRPQPLAARAVGLPATVAVDLVGRRPDLASARLTAQAFASRVKAAKADFYPNIALNGDYGLASLGIDKFVDAPTSIVGALGPALRLPIFSGGRLEGALRGERAQYDEAVATYDRTLAFALRDVASAAVGVRSLATELADARSALAASEDAYRVARLRYTGGLSPYLNVLTAETTLIQNRRAVADLQGQAASLDVELIRALGGGYRDPASPPAASIRTAAR